MAHEDILQDAPLHDKNLKWYTTHMKKIYLALLFAVLFIPIITTAQGFQFDPGGAIANSLKLPTRDANLLVVDVIRKILFYVIFVAVIVILYGGFRYLTSAGNEERVKSARTTLKVGVIGLVVIMLAYSIMTFIVAKVPVG